MSDSGEFGGHDHVIAEAPHRELQQKPKGAIAYHVPRILLWLAILVFCLLAQAALLEGILRVAGYGESTRFLARCEVDGKAYHTPNRAFYQQFSALPLDRIMTWDDLDFQVPEVKAPGARRIFVFGGSAIYGTRTSARILEMMLRERAPSVQWEVYNAACPGMNSHVMVQAARACAALEPDVFLVYMGNNEAVGPFGPATALGRSRLFWRTPIIRALIAANELRTVQLLRRAGAATSLNLPDTDALMRMLPGMTDHPKTLMFYERNVRDVCASAARANATALLCTLSGNRRFMGVVAPPESADESGQSINGIVRRQAARHDNALLADVAGKLAAHSEDGLPGYDFFVDNVHFNFAGNYLAASAMFEALAPLLQLDGAPPEKEACAAALAWTPAAEFDLLGWQLQAFLDDHSRDRVRRRYDALREVVDENWRAQLFDDHITALQRHPDDLYLRQTAFRLAFDLGDADAATEQSRELRARHPAARAALRSAGVAAALRGEAEAAVAGYRACLDVYPDDPEALRRLAELLFTRGDKDAAEPLYKRYLRIDGTDAFVWCRIGEIQAHRGQARRAAATWLRVIEQAPTHPYAYRLLD
ncbi:MAG TPA: tetratricopeptide repeat protein, partial [Candidatus Hydrogenedentes bacterium]|nr:tetratricopeptide repeat protein [Candidatus Hydrogenedentota bacterium]